MSEPRTADVVIIGAGVIGAATAFELAKLGFKTINLDRNHDAGTGSTAGSCACIRVHYSTYDGAAIAYEGYHYWRDWTDYLEVGDPAGMARFEQTGCLVMATEQNNHLEKQMHFCDMLGCPFEQWDAARINQRLPIYDLASFAPARSVDDPAFGMSNGARLRGGVYFPTAGHVTDPQLSAHNLMIAAQAKGAAFLFNAAVSEILRSNGRTAGVKLGDGRTIHAPVVVNVAGPASSRINRMAGVLDDMTISTRALRQEVCHLPSPEGFDFEADGLMFSDSDICLYARPVHGNSILVGSEDPPCDLKEWVDDDNDYNRDFTEQWTLQAYRFAQRVPSLGIPSRMKGVVDLYDVTEDWIPIYDKSSLPGYYMACGTSGNQYKNAPVAGKLMAALIQACEDGHDHDRDPIKLQLPYIDRRIDTGFYSRKRPINQDSSFSVIG